MARMGGRLTCKRVNMQVYTVILGGADQTVSNEEADLELRPEANWKPMRLASNAGRNMRELRYPQYDPRCFVQDGLETV